LHEQRLSLSIEDSYLRQFPQNIAILMHNPLSLFKLKCEFLIQRGYPESAIRGISKKNDIAFMGLQATEEFFWKNNPNGITDLE
jgi:hypothetical protein